MTVAELIAKLQEMPPDAPVAYPFGDDGETVGVYDVSKIDINAGDSDAVTTVVLS